MANQMTIDKLIEICEREYHRGMATGKYSKYDCGYATAFKLCLSFTKELKGNVLISARWKGAGLGDFTCSWCSETVSRKSNYCPNCGSKMDGKNENAN